MFEMLVGYPPFYSDQPSQTWQKILHWKEHFVIPPEVTLSREARDLIHGLVCDSETRLGRNGAEEIKKHPFFRGLDWDNIRAVKAPNIPQVSSEISAENFDKFDEDKLANEERKYHKRHGAQGNKRVDIDFIDYTYKGDVELERLMLVNVLKELDTIDPSLCGPTCASQDSSQHQTLEGSITSSQMRDLQLPTSSGLTDGRYEEAARGLMAESLSDEDEVSALTSKTVQGNQRINESRPIDSKLMDSRLIQQKSLEEEQKRR